MEVQQLPQQSVQINLNNKIITLHNVTIVKNPRIVKVDAAQYSNLLKGATVGNGPQIKFINSGAVKLPMPSLVPMKSQAPALVRTNNTFLNHSNSQNSVIVNQNPLIKHAGNNYVQTHVIKTIQAPTNGLVQLKSSLVASPPQNSSAAATLVSPVKIQAIPVKQTVIISPPKTSNNINNTAINNVVSSQKNASVPQNVNVNMIKMVQATTPPPLLQTIPQIPQQKEQIVCNQTSVITKPPIIANQTSPIIPPIINTNSASTPILPIKTNVIVSPPLKNKSSMETSSSPDSKKQCTKFEFQCIFCKAMFLNEPHLLLEHMKDKHPDKIPSETTEKAGIEEAKIAANDQHESLKINPEESINNNNKMEANEITNEFDNSNKMETDSDSSSSLSEDDDEMSENSEETLGDDDESEVHDLIMDLENPQDESSEDESDNQTSGNESDSSESQEESDGNESDGESSQDRSNTPESPEFEEHIAEGSNENKLLSSEIYDEYTDDDYDLDILAILLEPFVDLQCSDDFEDNNSQEENEAMKLYREAMEINYEQNGIKKRGRRKSRVPKVSNESLSMNGILANLLDTSIKIPQGPGRGRRKEVNEQELEMDRSNGICFFQCTQCDKSFKFAGDLAKHVRSHTISSPYRCSICGKVFTHIGSLNTHLRIHSGERPYKCKFCDKSFTQSNSLMVHVKSHLSNKPFSCNQCNKGFLNASSLALHQKTHTGPVVIVVCPIETCGKEFRDNNLLEEHMQTHKQSLLYQCSQCLEKFEQACQLVQHVKIHVGDKPFQCTICSRAFTQPGSLNTHLRIHTGEKPFSCTLCPKRFTQASSLSVHMKIHGEKEFKCEICNKSYNQEAFLLKHKLKHQENNTENGEGGYDTMTPQE